VLLPIVKFMQCFEYWVVCINVCVIHVYIVSTDFIDIIFLQGVQMSALPSHHYDVQGMDIVPYVCPVFNI
jgi:hypothetical protein